MYQTVKIGPLDLIYSPFKSFQTASLGIFLRAGARFEKKSQKGIAHFLEHMLFKGSRSYSYKRIKREIEGRGGLLNGFTSQEITAYYAHFLQKNTLLTLDILLDMILNPLLAAREIDKEREVILEEIKMYNDLPLSRAKTILDSLIWEGHPLGEDIIGSRRSVERITRKDLSGFKNNFYTPDNIVISFCGNFPLGALKELVAEKVKINMKTKKHHRRRPSAQKGIKIKSEKKETLQSHLCLGFRSIPFASRRRAVQELLHVVLGANMSSRLFESLREKKSLCYDVSTEVKKFKDSGAFLIRAGLNSKKIKQALAAVKREIEKIKEKEISKRELLRAKDYSLGQLAMSLEQPQARMLYFAQSRIKAGRIESIGEIKQQIEAVEPRQIRDFARRLFNFGNICMSVVGNIEEEKILKLKNELKK